MDARLEKAKEIMFSKTFCFMQWQADDASARGEKVMGKEDIEYILSLKDLKMGDRVSFDGTSDGFFSPMERYVDGKLFDYIDLAKAKGSVGLSIIDKDITLDEDKKVREMDGYVNYTWMGSTKGCDIYFSEEAFILSHVLHFQNSFSCLADAFTTRLI